jgi:hypothetical protein
MLFMVIEHFHAGAVSRIHERFSTQGRLLPEGVKYVASWIDPERLRCFQVMEAPDVDRLAEWTAHWADLVEFEVIPVQTSQQFWSTTPR